MRKEKEMRNAKKSTVQIYEHNKMCESSWNSWNLMYFRFNFKLHNGFHFFLHFFQHLHAVPDENYIFHACIVCSKKPTNVFISRFINNFEMEPKKENIVSRFFRSGFLKWVPNIHSTLPYQNDYPFTRY